MKLHHTIQLYIEKVKLVFSNYQLRKNERNELGGVSLIDIHNEYEKAATIKNIKFEKKLEDKAMQNQLGVMLVRKRLIDDAKRKNNLEKYYNELQNLVVLYTSYAESIASTINEIHKKIDSLTNNSENADLIKAYQTETTIMIDYTGLRLHVHNIVYAVKNLCVLLNLSQTDYAQIVNDFEQLVLQNYVVCNNVFLLNNAILTNANSNMTVANTNKGIYERNALVLNTLTSSTTIVLNCKKKIDSILQSTQIE